MQQNLPFDPQNPMYPWFRVSPTEPPFVPNVQLAEQWMYQYVPWVTGMLATEIQTNATLNPLRMFMFNASAANAWQNDDFVGLVVTTLNFVGMMMARRQYVNPDQGINTAVPYIVSLAVAANVRDFPGLQGYIDQQTYRDVNDSIMEFDAIRRDLQHYLGGYHQQTAAAQPYDPRFGVDNRGGGQQTYRPIYGQQQQGGAVSRGIVGSSTGSGRFGSSQRQAPQGNPARPNLPHKPSVYSRFAKDNQSSQPFSIEQPFEARTEMPQQVETQQPTTLKEADGSILVKELESSYTWKPSAKQNYRPVYHPLTQERYHRVFDDGTVLVEVRDRDPIDMEFDKHQVPGFGHRRDGVGYDHAKALEKMSRAAVAVDVASGIVKQAEALAASDQSEEANTVRSRLAKGEDHAVVEPARLTDVSERILWLNAGVNRMARAAVADKPLDLHRTYAYLADPVICQQNVSDFIKRLGESRTYIELAEKLNGAVGEVELRVLEMINKRLIQMVNRVCSLYLSLPDGDAHISDSFDSDTLRDQEKYIHEQYGPVIAQAFKLQQRRHIQSVFFDLPDNIKTELSDALFGNVEFKDGTKPSIGFLTSQYSFTFVDVLAAELDIDFDQDTTSLIEAGNNQALYQIARQLFVSTENELPFYRHLIQTNDGEILELVKGDVGKDAYLLCKNPELWAD
jgi:hypothetical protein